MKIQPRTEIGRSAWDVFIEAHPQGWFWHTWAWLDYLAAWEGAVDCSFGIQEGGQLAALCPLVLDEDGSSGPPAWPLVSPASIRATTELWEEATRRAQGIGRSSLTIRQASPFAPPAGVPEGWRDVSWRTRVLDLTLSPTALHAGVRKSYRHLINRGLKEWECVIDGTGASSEAYQAVHQASLGQRPPRPQRTYDLQAEWVRQGLAFQVGARRRLGGFTDRGDDPRGVTGGSSPPPSTIPSVGGWVAWCYVFCYRGGAYYGSGPSLVPGAMHALLWTAILAAQRRGLQWFDMGWQGQAQDDKEFGIERFKAGFGGRDIPLTVAEVGL